MAGDSSQRLDPAKVFSAKTFSCASCGGSVSISAIGHTVTVTCRSCGSLIDATDENYKIIHTVSEKLKIEPIIPLGTRGKFRGVLWEVIGFMRRCDGTGAYSWSEYLLFNPGRGFRWLTEFDGHWNYTVVTKEKPELEESDPRKSIAKYMGKKYSLFHLGKARVSYVVGEFYWRVKVGEKVAVRDYISPPELLSCEMKKDEVTWAVGEYVEGYDIKSAFKLTNTTLPIPKGVSPNQPATMSSAAPSILRLWAVFLTILFFIQLGSISRSKETEVYADNFSHGAAETEKVKSTPQFELKGGTSNLAFTLFSPVNNNWLEVEVELVNDETGETEEFEQGVEFYSGWDSDGSWSEGSTRSTVFLSAVPDGKYHLNIQATKGGNNPSELSPERIYHLSVRRDVATWGNFFWVVVLVSIFPLFVWWRSRNFELARWSNSDFSPYWEQREED